MKYLQPYAGVAAGFKWEDSYIGNSNFTWKLCGGIRLPFSVFCINTDISYGTILGVASTISIGIYK